MDNLVKEIIGFIELLKVKKKFMISSPQVFWEENIGNNYHMVVHWDQVGTFSGLGANLI